mmetsp:Transcript_28700/g.75926  ORF Transcript_28700/g.75926 Transcript_28700/m.75926 type:complete len:203 (-) Transcript_28700:1106-1714(-)
MHRLGKGVARPQRCHCPLEGRVRHAGRQQQLALVVVLLLALDADRAARLVAQHHVLRRRDPSRGRRAGPGGPVRPILGRAVGSRPHRHQLAQRLRPHAFHLPHTLAPHEQVLALGEARLVARVRLDVCGRHLGRALHLDGEGLGESLRHVPREGLLPLAEPRGVTRLQCEQQQLQLEVHRVAVGGDIRLLERLTVLLLPRRA